MHELEINTAKHLRRILRCVNNAHNGAFLSQISRQLIIDILGDECNVPVENKVSRIEHRQHVVRADHLRLTLHIVFFANYNGKESAHKDL